MCIRTEISIINVRESRSNMYAKKWNGSYSARLYPTWSRLIFQILRPWHWCPCHSTSLPNSHGSKATTSENIVIFLLISFIFNTLDNRYVSHRVQLVGNLMNVLSGRRQRMKNTLYFSPSLPQFLNLTPTISISINTWITNHNYIIF